MLRATTLFAEPVPRVVQGRADLSLFTCVFPEGGGDARVWVPQKQTIHPGQEVRLYTGLAVVSPHRARAFHPHPCWEHMYPVIDQQQPELCFRAVNLGSKPFTITHHMPLGTLEFVTPNNEHDEEKHIC